MIDPSFIDVDFTQQPQYVNGDNGARRFGHKREQFSDNVAVIPRTQWPELCDLIAKQGGGLDLLAPRIYDQKSTVSCTSNATAKATEIIEHQQYGLEGIVEKSAMSLYERVGGPRSGSSVDDNIDELCERGILPLNNEANRAKYKHVMANADGYQRCPAGWEETAKLFRAHEWFEINKVEEFITALLIGYPVVYGRSGHAICAARPKYEGNSLLVKYFNSWHESWGDKGFGYDSERMVRSGASWAFALRSMRSRN